MEKSLQTSSMSESTRFKIKNWIEQEIIPNVVEVSPYPDRMRALYASNGGLQATTAKLLTELCQNSTLSGSDVEPRSA